MHKSWWFLSVMWMMTESCWSIQLYLQKEMCKSMGLAKFDCRVGYFVCICCLLTCKFICVSKSPFHVYLRWRQNVADPAVLGKRVVQRWGLADSFSVCRCVCWVCYFINLFVCLNSLFLIYLWCTWTKTECCWSSCIEKESCAKAWDWQNSLFSNFDCICGLFIC